MLPEPRSVAAPGTGVSDEDVLHAETIVADAEPEQLEGLHRALSRLWTGMSTQPELDWRLRFETAVMEIANNVVEHAYAAEQRRGRIELRLTAYRDRVEAHFSDRGAPFGRLSVQQEPGIERAREKMQNPGALADSGRGLTITRAAVDTVEYSRTQGVNRWRLVKLLGA